MKKTYLISFSIILLLQLCLPGSLTAQSCGPFGNSDAKLYVDQVLIETNMDGTEDLFVNLYFINRTGISVEDFSTTRFFDITYTTGGTTAPLGVISLPGDDGGDWIDYATYGVITGVTPGAAVTFNVSLRDDVFSCTIPTTFMEGLAPKVSCEPNSGEPELDFYTSQTVIQTTGAGLDVLMNFYFVNNSGTSINGAAAPQTFQITYTGAGTPSVNPATITIPGDDAGNWREYNTSIVLRGVPEGSEVSVAIAESNSGLACTQNFTIGLSILPVELMSFTAEPRGKTILLDWITATERDNSGFAVMRSTDHENFEEIGWLASNGNSNTESTYLFVDETARAGIVYYYRLHSTAVDGAVEISNVVSAMTGETAKAVGEFYPNPTHEGLVKIDVVSEEHRSSTVVVYNITGREVYREELISARGLNVLSFDLSHLDKGLYLAKIGVGENQMTRKILVH